MPSGYLAGPTNPIIFLINVIFGLYMTVVSLRIIMQWAQWEYHNPVVQLIIKATQIPVKYLRNFIPAIGRWDTATIVLLLLISVIKVLLISLVNSGKISPAAIFYFAITDIFSLFITLFSVSIIIGVILSWIQPHSYNPITPLIHRMNSPILNPIRKRLPAFEGIDFSPLLALIGLQLVQLTFNYFFQY